MVDNSYTKRDVSRRKVMSAIAVTGSVALAGCADTVGELGSQALNRPTPEVVDAEAQQGLDGLLSGERTVRVLVRNEGGEGDIRIEIEFLDASGTVIQRAHRTVLIKSGETREYQFDVESPEGVEQYRVTAEPAE